MALKSALSLRIYAGSVQSSDLLKQAAFSLFVPEVNGPAAYQTRLRSDSPQQKKRALSSSDLSIVGDEIDQQVKYSNDSGSTKRTKSTKDFSDKFRNGVSFAPIVQVYETLHRSNYSDEEKNAVWYTPFDRRRIKAERVETIQAVVNKTFVENDRYSARGLETPEEKTNRADNTFVAIDCVLEEQNLQVREGVNDPEYIALLYQYCCLCNNGSKIAQMKALSDHQSCLQEDIESHNSPVSITNISTGRSVTRYAYASPLAQSQLSSSKKQSQQRVIHDENSPINI